MLLSYVSFRETASSENYCHSFLTEVLGITRGPNRSVGPTPGGENGSTEINVCNYERSTAALLGLKKSSEPPSA